MGDIADWRFWLDIGDGLRKLGAKIQEEVASPAKDSVDEEAEDVAKALFVGAVAAAGVEGLEDDEETTAADGKDGAAGVTKIEGA